MKLYCEPEHSFRPGCDPLSRSLRTMFAFTQTLQHRYIWALVFCCTVTVNGAVQNNKGGTKINYRTMSTIAVLEPTGIKAREPLTDHLLRVNRTRTHWFTPPPSTWNNHQGKRKTVWKIQSITCASLLWGRLSREQRGWPGLLQSILLTGRDSDKAQRHLSEQSRAPRRHATLAPGQQPKLAPTRQTSPLRLTLCSSVCPSHFLSFNTRIVTYRTNKDTSSLVHPTN